MLGLTPADTFTGSTDGDDDDDDDDAGDEDDDVNDDDDNEDSIYEEDEGGFDEDDAGDGGEHFEVWQPPPLISQGGANLKSIPIKQVDTDRQF